MKRNLEKVWRFISFGSLFLVILTIVIFIFELVHAFFTGGFYPACQNPIYTGSFDSTPIPYSNLGKILANFVLILSFFSFVWSLFGIVVSFVFRFKKRLFFILLISTVVVFLVFLFVSSALSVNCFGYTFPSL